MLFSILSSLLLAATTSALPTEVKPRATNQYLTNSHAAITELQTFYNSPRPGFWSAGWWNSANCLTLLADLRAKDSSSFLTSITDGPNGVFKHTLNSQNKDGTGALAWDDFFDDQLWWTVALIKTYDVTKDTSFLKTANDTFNAVTLNNKPSNNPCGGLANAYPSEKYLVKSSTIATVLYVEAAALLSTRYPTQKTYYLDKAKTQWSWLSQNILIDGIMQGDALTGTPPSCSNNHAFLTYIEGVALQALVALYHATNDAFQRVYTFALFCAAIPHISTIAILSTALLFPIFFANDISTEFHPSNLFVPISPFSRRQADTVGQGAHWFLQWDMTLMFLTYLVWAYFAVIKVNYSNSGVLSASLILRLAGWSLLFGPMGAALLAIWERDDLIFEAEEQKIRSRNNLTAKSTSFS